MDMTSDNITQIIITVLTIIGSPIFVSFINKKKEDRRVISYKRIFDVLRNTQHYCLELSEYFRTATNIRLKCSDIKKLVDDDNAIWIIYFLKKMPGYVQYENGILKHAKRFKDKWYLPWVKKFNQFVSIFGQAIAFAGYLIFSFGFIYFGIAEEKNHIGISAFFIIMVFVSAFGFVSASKMKAENEKIDELIGLYAKNVNDNEEKNDVHN